MIWFEGKLFLRLALLFLELIDLGREHNFWRSGGINAISLDRHDETSTVLEEHVGVESDDTSLVRLGDIGKDHINHTDEHAVSVRLTSILDDRNDIRALLGHVGELTARAVGEFDSVDNAFRSDHIGDVGDGGSRGTSEVQHAGAGADRHVADTSDDGSSELGTERIPDTVFG